MHSQKSLSLQVAITHVASQLANTYIPLPIGSEIVEGESWQSMSFKDWKECVLYFFHKPLSGWIWPNIIAKRFISCDRLAATIHQHFDSLAAVGGKFIPITSDKYPFLLKQIHNPPAALSALGSIERLLESCVGVIGARKASRYALDKTSESASYFVKSGVTVVSGGAFGCDIEAHRASLTSENQYRTIVVFASGLSNLYPLHHKNDFDRIVNNGGLLVSERLWGAGARPLHFPIRNRIIAGLVPALFVMQAAQKSGARLTANLALDFGREVFVLRHPANDVRALGSQGLINDGATFFISISDII